MNKKINYMHYLLIITAFYGHYALGDFPTANNMPPRVGGGIIEITSMQQFNDYISQPNSAVFVDFYTSWCSPCIKAKPIVHNVANDKRFSAITFLAVDANRTPEIAQQYNIKGVPTFSYFYNGRLMVQETGLKSVQTLHQTIASNFARFFPNLMNQIDSDDTDTTVTTTTVMEKTDNPDEMVTSYEKTTTTSTGDDSNIFVKIGNFFGSILMAIKDVIMSIVDTIRGWFM